MQCWQENPWDDEPQQFVVIQTGDHQAEVISTEALLDDTIELCNVSEVTAVATAIAENNGDWELADNMMFAAFDAGHLSDYAMHQWFGTME
jgi:hypothetical protein